MDIERFDLECWQSVHEHDVEINLSESGVHPLRLQEIIETADLEALLAQELGYPQTNGGSEANFVACWHLIEPGDEVVVIQPTYMQIPGLVRSFGATVREVWLEDDQGGDGDHGDDAHDPMRWRLDLAAVRAAVTPRTRCIVVCNPNNPTGARLDESEVAELCALAEDLGCWVLADEIYRGAELDGRDTPPAWGRHDRVIVTGGLSKTYGLPGLRIGWIVGPAELVEQLWGRQDYTPSRRAPSTTSSRGSPSPPRDAAVSSRGHGPHYERTRRSFERGSRRSTVSARFHPRSVGSRWCATPEPGPRPSWPRPCGRRTACWSCRVCTSGWNTIYASASVATRACSEKVSRASVGRWRTASA